MIIPIALISGLVGSLADSVLGATVQRKGVCTVCGKESENHTHCDKPTRVLSGLPFVDNNIVNLLATLAGAATAFVVAFILSLRQGCEDVEPIDKFGSTDALLLLRVSVSESDGPVCEGLMIDCNAEGNSCLVARAYLRPIEPLSSYDVSNRFLRTLYSAVPPL